MRGEARCPTCGSTNLRVMRLPNVLLVHWVLNPGIAFNELVLGQRIPATMLECRACPRPRLRRYWVPCPSCSELHDGMLWSRGNAFGHWFGYFCPGCGGCIPCLWNVFSLVVLAVLSPLWWPVARLVRSRAIEFAVARVRAARERLSATGYREPNWVLMGASYAAFMWLFMSALEVAQGSFSPSRALTLAVIWSAAGVFFGGFMRWYMLRVGRAT